MIRTRANALAVGMLILGVAELLGSDAFVVRFDTSRDPVFFPPCGGLVYRDELLFYNRGGADATVSLLGVSNGPPGNPKGLTVPAGRIRTVLAACQGCSAPASWAPDPQPLLWVAHLDVPDQIEVTSRLLVLAGSPTSCPSFPGRFARTFAGLRMPVVRSLTPAGVPQVHLGTDIGGNVADFADDGRTNVGIYNAGAVEATATVEFRRGCDGTSLETRTSRIPANTILQLNGFSNVFSGCSALEAGGFEVYTVVTVDQPSLSYTVTLSNQRDPLLSMSTSP